MPSIRSNPGLLALLAGPCAGIAALLAGCSTGDSIGAPARQGDSAATELHEGREGPGRGPTDHPSPGPYRREVTCDVAEAKALFDRGLMWSYGFNHDEAIRCFQRAQELAPDFAMAHWGEAHARGPNINDPLVDPDRNRAAYAAAQRALTLVDGVSPVERALIVAQAKRYTEELPEDRGPLDRAYADAMASAWAKFGDDPDVGALYAESLLDLNPWDQWSATREPQHETLKVMAVLEEVIRMAPEHPGAHHFYIHTVENSPTPELGLPSAKVLPRLAPNSGHLVHMPAHILQRVGRYNESVAANRAAVEVDRRYLEAAGPQGIYHFYYIHNQHFEAWSTMYAGREQDAVAAAQAILDDAPPHVRNGMAPYFDGFQAVPIHVALRFGRWDDVLAAPERGDQFPIYRALRHYGRGVALAATGDVAAAKVEQEAFAHAATKVTDGMTIGVNPAPPVMEIARDMLAGEILYREGRFDEAFRALREAVAHEDQLRYDEPSPWMQPVRHALGALLLEQGRAAEAESVFRADLTRHTENGWALHGLSMALEQLGRRQEAAAVRERFEAAWSRADVQLAAACFCARDAGAAPVAGR